MWFQYLIQFLVVIAAAWLAWKYIIKQFVEAAGIDVDEEKEIKTDHTERLQKVKEEFKAKKASVEAVRKEKELKTDIHTMDEEIKETDRKIEDL